MNRINTRICVGVGSPMHLQLPVINDRFYLAIVFILCDRIDPPFSR